MVAHSLINRSFRKTVTTMMKIVKNKGTKEEVKIKRYILIRSKEVVN